MIHIQPGCFSLVRFESVSSTRVIGGITLQLVAQQLEGGRERLIAGVLVSVHSHSRSHPHSHSCTHAHAHGHVHTHAYVHTRARAHMHAHVHMHTHMHMHAHAHMHTHAPTRTLTLKTHTSMQAGHVKHPCRACTHEHEHSHLAPVQMLAILRTLRGKAMPPLLCMQPGIWQNMSHSSDILWMELLLGKRGTSWSRLRW